MKYTLRHYAARHFPHLSAGPEREHEAETDLVRRFFDGREPGYYVEVGANDPRRFSQTWHLEQRGWSGVLVEPIPELCDRLAEQRPRSRIVRAACGAPENRGDAEFYVATASDKSALKKDLLDFSTSVDRIEKVRVLTLDEVLDEASLPRIDFVSIDVEGLQLDVLRGLTLSAHQPRLLLIEDHLTNLRTHRYLVNRNYRLVKRTGLNNWYVPVHMPFDLACRRERFGLWRKLWLRTPARKLRYALRRVLQHVPRQTSAVGS